jgi:hypothetical protein
MSEVQGASVMSGVSAVLKRVHQALEGCVKLLPPAGEGDDRGRLLQERCQHAMRGLDLEMGSDICYQEIVLAMQCAVLALDKLVALARPETSTLEDGRMGALRKRIVDSGVLPDLITALAEVWSITSAEDLPTLSRVRPRTAIAHGGMCAGAWGAVRLVVSPQVCPELSLNPSPTCRAPAGC